MAMTAFTGVVYGACSIMLIYQYFVCFYVYLGPFALGFIGQVIA